MLDGKLTLDEIRERLRGLIEATHGGDQVYVYVPELTDEAAVYSIDGPNGPERFFRVGYTVDEDGEVALAGEPDEVEREVVWRNVVEARDVLKGRVLEARGKADSGGRIFRVRVLTYGDSINGRRYTESVMRRAAARYEGAKAYDHHRTAGELETSTTSGIVGYYRNVEAGTAGIDADLHLLPSATATAELLDASLALQAAGSPPLVGISHDVQGLWRPVQEGGRRLMEATEIVAVNSADVVAQPSAGGHATRAVAGGSGDVNHPETGEEATTMEITLEKLLELIGGASEGDRAKVLASLGVTDEQIKQLTTNPPVADEVDEDAEDRTLVGAAAESVEHARESVSGRRLIADVLEDRGLDRKLVGAIQPQLPDRFTEADVTAAVTGLQKAVEALELADLKPTIEGTNVEVTQAEHDRKVEALEKLVTGESGGYVSLKQAWRDMTGFDGDPFVQDVNAMILREAQMSGRVVGSRGVESITSSTFGEALADVMHKALLRTYQNPGLSNWSRIVSSFGNLTDFRDNKRVRIGGYGQLPTVGQGAPYQPLTTPDDEQETYSAAKKGGTEDLTLEAIANDDVGALRNIPRKLGVAAAKTIHAFVWNLITSNPTMGDGVALFAAGHSNTDASSALTNATLTVGRRKMRSQTEYGDSAEALGILPKFLVVPNELEQTAFHLTQSAVAVPASGNSSDLPNMHTGLEPLVVDRFTDADDWYLVADPSMHDTVEVGFYQGRREPELFVQDSPTVGSMFDADKVTYKIRHIYGGTVLEWRSFYRGQG